ncbi:alanine/glycine:cation symporter family protein [Pseudoflavonifractor phocaeensis]|uniref:alanine/glycine:cation symporter family protein n=1 Tax=Pseudoflavonifractor phocaeensis TaxID=1870988 RepID=UPI0019580C46|nr:alanine/glycine:cation symporter family protein [Pseudoflavonifractor phocaeensis]MBM6924464.1 alanine:cation symporter family protein [Pseudoflavonifractor phocaeensis]
MALEKLGDLLWNPWLLGLFLLTGLYLSVRSGFFQLFGLPVWLRATIGSLGKREGRGEGKGLTRLQAMSTALAATIGTGSIAGVATAIFYGGPGAVFWMWISAFLGMMTGCVEKILAVRYRERDRQGGYRGGPMVYMEQGLGNRTLASLFSLCCIGASLGGGSMVQSNSISTALWAAFGWDRLAVGGIAALLTGLVIVGGVGRIGKVSETLVPCMALLFVGGGLVVLVCRRQVLPAALAQILEGAFAPKAVLGGGAGYGMAAALRYGVARGVFTNEAGIGTSAIAHAAADTREPAEQGMWGIFEVFLATGVVCTVTALVILTTGVYDPQTALAAIHSGRVDPQMVGAPLSAAGFSAVLGPFGGIFVAVCLLMFAFTSLLGCGYYGERSLEYLTGSPRGRRGYRVLFLLAVVWGSVADVRAVWELADIFNGLMALPNLCTILLLSPEALGLLSRWEQGRKKSRSAP